MQGTQLDRVISEAQTGVQLCEAYQYAPLKPECDRMKVEFEGMKYKSKALKENMNALDYKQREAGVEEIVGPEQKIIAQKSTLSTGAAATTFLLSTGVAFAGIWGYYKVVKS